MAMPPVQEVMVIPDFLRPPFPPPIMRQIALLRVVLEHDVDGRTQRNVFHVGAPNFPLDDDQNAALNDLFQTWWTVGTFSGPPPNVYQSSRSQFIRILKYFIPDEIPLSAEFVDYFEVFVFGAGDFPPLAANSTVAVQWSTETAGPGGRGRSYFPGLAQVAVDENDSNQLRLEIVPTLVNAFHQLNVALLQLAIDRGEFWSHLLFHKNPRAGSLLFNGHADQITVTRMTDATLDSQYRRLPNHKRHGRN